MPQNRRPLLLPFRLPFQNSEVYLNHTAEEWNSERTGTAKRNKRKEGLREKAKLVPANTIKDKECVN